MAAALTERAASAPAESSPFQLLAQSVTFAVTLLLSFSAPVIFTSWTGWVMIWQ